MTLPNDRPVTEYQGAAQEILDVLPVDDARYAKYRSALEQHRRAIRDTLTGKSLHALASALESLLHDVGESADAGHPNLKEFWEQPDPKVQSLKSRIEDLSQRVQYGDPLVISARSAAAGRSPS